MIVDPRFIEADRTIADLRSQLEADAKERWWFAAAVVAWKRQLEAVQLNAHVHSDHDVWVDEKHSEYFGCRTCLAAEGLEMQLEVATATLRTVQREADSERKVSDIWQDRAQAERTKREEADERVRTMTDAAHEAAFRAEEAERQLGEALPLIDEAVCDFENGDDLWEDWKQRARAVLASRPSDVSAPAAAEPSAQTEAETENPRREPGA